VSGRSATGRESTASTAQATDYVMRHTKYHCRDLECAVSRSDAETRGTVPKFSDMFHGTLVLPFSWDRSDGIVTRLRARRPKYRC
jgi:hypothetical protein